jgi:hypothetical protein
MLNDDKREARIGRHLLQKSGASFEAASGRANPHNRKFLGARHLFRAVHLAGALYSNNSMGLF